MAVGDLIDANELVYVLLFGSATLKPAVTDSLGVHIYGPPGLPDEIVLPNGTVSPYSIRKTCVYLLNSPNADSQLPVDMANWQILFYAPDAVQAHQLALAMRKDIHRMGHTRLSLSGGTALLQYARLLSGPTPRVEPESEYDYVYTQWEIQYNECYIP